MQQPTNCLNTQCKTKLMHPPNFNNNNNKKLID